MRWRDEAKIRHRQSQNHQYTGLIQIFGSKLQYFFPDFSQNNTLFLQTQGETLKTQEPSFRQTYSNHSAMQT